MFVGKIVYDFCFRHITSDKFIFEPIDTGENELLVIDRVSQEITLQGKPMLTNC